MSTDSRSNSLSCISSGWLVATNGSSGATSVQCFNSALTATWQGQQQWAELNDGIHSGGE